MKFNKRSNVASRILPRQADLFDLVIYDEASKRGGRRRPKPQPCTLNGTSAGSLNEVTVLIRDAPNIAQFQAGLDLGQGATYANQGDVAGEAIEWLNETQARQCRAFLQKVFSRQVDSHQTALCSNRVHALRNRIERFFNRIKNSRRVATRYDKLIESFAASCSSLQFDSSD